MSDDELVEAFRNFLSWGQDRFGSMVATNPVPPAWWAYVLGATSWCPPKGEM
jgi:hypothetical protein